MPDPVITSIIVVLLVLLGPFLSRRIEHNLEAFLLAMGLASAVASGVLDRHLVAEALRDPVPITTAVFVSGLLFAWGRRWIASGIRAALARTGPAVLTGLTVVVLGLVSSIITAIIASLILVEYITVLRLRRADEVRAVVLACFAIGLGAALTPVGEPLSTIATAKLGQDFWFLARLLGPLIVPGVAAIGVLAWRSRPALAADDGLAAGGPAESLHGVVVRAFRVYIFVGALTLLGAGLRPLIDRYIIGLDARLLYWINMISAILDNATLTAAEISPRMIEQQIRAVLMGLLISGGMLIPGNIPNIVAAGKLKIGSREWARVAVPIGAVLMVAYFAILFMR